MLPNKSNQPYRVELLFPRESRWLDLVAANDDDAFDVAEGIADTMKAPAFRIYDPSGCPVELGIAI